MNRIVVALALGAGLACSSTARAEYVQLNFGGSSSEVEFSNGTITFVGGIVATSVQYSPIGASTPLTNPGTSSSTNQITGTFSPGGSTFTFTPNASDLTGNSGTVTESPSTTLTLTSTDGTTLKANSVVFNSITTGPQGSGSNGDIFTQASVTLSNFQLSQGATDSNLIALAADNVNISATFLFTGTSLNVQALWTDSFTTSPPIETTYTGQIVGTDPVAPAPASWAMLISGAGLLGGFGVARRRRTLSLA